MSPARRSLPGARGRPAVPARSARRPETEVPTRTSLGLCLAARSPAPGPHPQLHFCVLPLVCLGRFTPSAGLLKSNRRLRLRPVTPSTARGVASRAARFPSSRRGARRAGAHRARQASEGSEALRAVQSEVLVFFPGVRAGLSPLLPCALRREGGRQAPQGLRRLGREELAGKSSGLWQGGSTRCSEARRPAALPTCERRTKSTDCARSGAGCAQLPCSTNCDLEQNKKMTRGGCRRHLNLISSLGRQRHRDGARTLWLPHTHLKSSYPHHDFRSLSTVTLWLI